MKIIRKWTAKSPGSSGSVSTHFWPCHPPTATGQSHYQYQIWPASFGSKWQGGSPAHEPPGKNEDSELFWTLPFQFWLKVRSKKDQLSRLFLCSLFFSLFGVCSHMHVLLLSRLSITFTCILSLSNTFWSPKSKDAVSSAKVATSSWIPSFSSLRTANSF